MVNMPADRAGVLFCLVQDVTPGAVLEPVPALRACDCHRPQSSVIHCSQPRGGETRPLYWEVVTTISRSSPEYRSAPERSARGRECRQLDLRHAPRGIKAGALTRFLIRLILVAGNGYTSDNRNSRRAPVPSAVRSRPESIPPQQHLHDPRVGRTSTLRSASADECRVHEPRDHACSHAGSELWFRLVMLLQCGLPRSPAMR